MVMSRKNRARIRVAPLSLVCSGKDSGRAMKAVVLAGGQEYGQCPLSRQAPRALWPLVDKPIIEHVLHALRGIGIGEMAVSANGRTPTIAAALGEHPSPDIAIHYSEDHLPRGAAGC